MPTARAPTCAAYLSALQDSIIQAVFGLATGHVYRTGTPSAAEHMAVVAVGGYGRGTLAPGSDVDLLFLLPYKQTPWGESVVEFILYLLWDLGLTVGHATRSVDECIRLARSDMTIRTAVLEARYITGERAALRDAGHPLRYPGGQEHRARVHRRQARRARPAPSPAGRHPLSGRAQRQGRQGRPARPPDAVLDRQVFLPRPLPRRSGQGRRLLAQRDCGSSARPRISSGRCAATCISSPAARRSGCPSTSSARWPAASATPPIPASRTSSAS